MFPKPHILLKTPHTLPPVPCQAEEIAITIFGVCNKSSTIHALSQPWFFVPILGRTLYAPFHRSGKCPGPGMLNRKACVFYSCGDSLETSNLPLTGPEPQAVGHLSLLSTVPLGLGPCRGQHLCHVTLHQYLGSEARLVLPWQCLPPVQPVGPPKPSRNA